MEILKLRPVGKDYLWGGRRLKEEFGKDIDIEPLAETWECSTHPDGASVIVSGTYRGGTLAEVIKAHPEFLGSSACGWDELPILVKLIDAKQDLSVQVHPGDDYALRHEGQRGKTEMWYVVDAAEGATLVRGFKHPMTEVLLREAIASGTLEQHLNRVSVRKGDVFYVPAGTVHALGAGVLVAEIQQNSNVTYRVYDYDRTDGNGQKRQLDIDKALEVMDMGPAASMAQERRQPLSSPQAKAELLCKCAYFETEHVQTDSRYSFCVTGKSFQVLLCINGAAVIANGETAMSISRGDCLFLPAGIGQCEVSGAIEILKIAAGPLSCPPLHFWTKCLAFCRCSVIYRRLQSLFLWRR